ncbi:MAG: MotA/TolQ/ExbB proton channel family protein [Phycisphaeraceae bacterium]|nr:MotA/TolQ/ExbB proton channel family protein [Phycisphaeraceae bacterium]
MLEILIKGRWMMLPLMACSVLALAVFIDRARAFWANRKVDSRSLRAKVLGMLEDGDLSGAARLCAGTPGPVSAVMLTGLQSYAKHKVLTNRPESITTIMEKAMEDYTLHALSAVEKRLNVLSTIGAAAPLLGMAGTVLGMINSFDKLAGAGGMDPSVVAGGISEALITTAAGLLIGLAAVVPYSIFTAMADRVALEIDEAATELIDFVATRIEGEQREEA